MERTSPFVGSMKGEDQPPWPFPYQMATVPGTVYGHNVEGYLRLSYGSVSKVGLEEACARLSKYFAAC